MKQSEIIPEFKEKELNIEYLTPGFEDEIWNQFRFIWQTIADYDVNLDFNQVIKLKDYSFKSDKYACQLMSLLKDEEFRDYLPSQMERFRKEFSPKSKAEQLIFNIFKDVCDEIYWVNDVMNMNEFKSLSGDKHESYFK